MKVTTFSLLLLFACSTTALADYEVGAGGKLTVTLDPRGRVVDVQVAGRSLLSSTRSLITIRDLSAAGKRGGKNLLTNGDFEDGSYKDGVPEGWQSAAVKHVNLSLETSGAARGKHALLFRPTGEHGSMALSSDAVAVEGSTRYRLSALVKAVNGYLFLAIHPIAWQKYVYSGEVRINGLYIHWFGKNKKSLGDVELVAFPHCNANQWKTISGEVRAPAGAAYAEAVIYVSLSNNCGVSDGLWVDDVRLIKSTEAEMDVEGAVKGGSTLKLSGKLKEGLKLSAELKTYKDRIEISGELKDRKKRSGTYELSVRLPVDLCGWNWWDDVRRKRTIAGEDPLENWISADYAARMPVALYSLAAVDNGSTSLAAGIDLSQPQFARIFYDPEAEELVVRFYLGISPQANSLKRKASFSALFFTFDPAWGFRAALDRFASFHPTVYFPQRGPAPYNGYGQGDYRSGSQPGPTRCEEEDAKGYFSAQYTATQIQVGVSAIEEGPPDYESIVAEVENSVTDPPGSTVACSVAYDSIGDWSFRYVKDVPWDSSMWRVSLVTCLDPEIPEGYGRFVYENEVIRAFEDTTAAGAELEGMLFDNFMSGPTVNLNPTHLRYADLTLTFDINTYSPARHLLSSVWEYMSWMRDRVDKRFGRDKCFVVNGWGVGTIQYLMQFVDLYGMEGWPSVGTNWNTEILDYRRALAYAKPLDFAVLEDRLSEEEARDIASLAKLYAVFTIRGPGTPGWDPKAEELLIEHSALVNRYRYLGWEPVTFATCNRTGIRIERYGSDVKNGIAFAVYNSSNKKQRFQLTIDAGALGLQPKEVTVIDIATNREVEVERDNNMLLIVDKLSGHRSLVLLLQ